MEGILRSARKVAGRRAGLLSLAALVAGVLLVTSASPAAGGGASGTWAWGSGDSGQLGDNSTSPSDVPVQVQNLSDVVSLAGELEASLAVRSDGTVWAWGDNNNGELGDGQAESESNVPVQVPGLSGIVSVAGGQYFGLAVGSDGTVWAWGANDFDQLGNSNGASDVPVQVDVPCPSGKVVQVAAGQYDSYALCSDGTIWAWGYNGLGELGDGSTGGPSATPVEVQGLSDAIAIGAGYHHGLAVDANGHVWAWGYNQSGQLGQGNDSNSDVALEVSGISGIVAVAGGNQHSLALGSDGRVWAWGYNDDGELGDGTTNFSYVPVLVPSLSGVVAIGAGGSHSLALESDGTVWGWGSDYYGQLGNGVNDTASDVPVEAETVADPGAVLGTGSEADQSLLGEDGLAPASSVAPAISGTVEVGQVLTGSVGSWSGLTPFTRTRQWLRCDAAGDNCVYVGVTGDKSYRVKAADAGHTIEVQVAATNAAGLRVARSAPTGVVQSNTVMPSISGTPDPGDVLTGSVGTWVGAGPIVKARQWLRCNGSGSGCVDVGVQHSGTGDKSYLVKNADRGHTIELQVTATGPWGTQVATSLPLPVPS